tara:strand:+ start:424 stop:1680 length:1257 start_codon:yes stop_codon:yes gene_type:complete
MRAPLKTTILHLQSKLAESELRCVEVQAESNRENAMLSAELEVLRSELEERSDRTEALELSVQELRRRASVGERAKSATRLALDEDQRANAASVVALRTALAKAERRVENAESRCSEAVRCARRAENSLAAERGAVHDLERSAEGALVLSARAEAHRDDAHRVTQQLAEVCEQRDAQRQLYVAAAKRSNQLEQDVAEARDQLREQVQQESRVARRAAQAELERHAAAERDLQADIAEATRRVDDVRAEERAANERLQRQINAMAAGEHGSEVRAAGAGAGARRAGCRTDVFARSVMYCSPSLPSPLSLSFVLSLSPSPQLLKLQRLAAEVEALLNSCDAVGAAVGDAVGKVAGGRVALAISRSGRRSTSGDTAALDGAEYADDLATRVRSADGALREAQRALNEVAADRVHEEECAQQ